MSVNLGTSRDANVPSGHTLCEKRASTLPVKNNDNIPLIVILEFGETWPEVAHVFHVQGAHLRGSPSRAWLPIDTTALAMRLAHISFGLAVEENPKGPGRVGQLCAGSRRNKS
eukprot:3333138-Pyramimonas_sp.AAC.1